METKSQELAAAIKAQVATGNATTPNETVLRIVEESRQVHADFLRELRRVTREIGVSEAEVRAMERARDAQLLPAERPTRFWRSEIEQCSPSGFLDDLVEPAVEQLVDLVDPKWLRSEAAKPYRLGADFLGHPLHLVNGVRVGMSLAPTGPQRFARMLLVSQDFLTKRPDFDFFSAAMFVPEVAQLGKSLDEIKELGPEAERKLAALPSMSDDLVTSTIYELLVGAACVRKGLTLTMMPENRSRKIPDYQVTGLAEIPGAIECKRRLGLTSYELKEAKSVERLYGAIRPLLHERGVHGSIEVCFTVPLESIANSDFIDDVLSVLDRDALAPTPTTWGSVAFQPLPHRRSISPTRLYSPDYLEAVFGWKPLQEEWDGILCEVDATPKIAVEIYSTPLCLKWRSESDAALTKKSRGITALWADAVNQIPDGDVGFIYVAYPEGSRAALADARTEYIREAASKFWHRWSLRVPVTMIARLYARPLGFGMPDLIESVMPSVTAGNEVWLRKLPWRVFT